MRRLPVARSNIYDLYWHFASKRQQIFELRLAGSSWPWTDDPILRSHKFCNVFRAADRVSQYMIRDVVYNAESSCPADRVFQILAFRVFSRIETWEAIRHFLGRAPSIVDITTGALLRAIEHARRTNGTLYTGAFILCAQDAYGRALKHENHVELFRHMFVKDSLADRLLGAPSLKAIYDLIHAYPLMGDFMAYQIAIDLNYATYWDFSENEFAQPGPGSVRGIAKAFVSLGDYRGEDVIRMMVERQADEFLRLGLPFGGLFGRPLHAIDCQGLFCELDKYCRVASPELTSARTRIKARYVENASPIEIFLPPKWNLSLGGARVGPPARAPEPRLFADAPARERVS